MKCLGVGLGRYEKDKEVVVSIAVVLFIHFLFFPFLSFLDLPIIVLLQHLKVT